MHPGRAEDRRTGEQGGIVLHRRRPRMLQSLSTGAHAGHAWQGARGGATERRAHEQRDSHSPVAVQKLQCAPAQCSPTRLHIAEE